MPGTIQRLEIFGAGTWTPASGQKVTVTEGHLDEMVANFYALNGTNIVKPHLKLGHTDAQKWFGQKVGIPTLGWISRIWREGAKLFADIDSVPEALLDLFRQGRYHNVSSEVFSPGQIEHDGKKFGHVLSAVAILGTEMPAVKDLAGLAAALYGQQFSSETKQEPVIFNQANGVAMFTQEQVDTLIAAAVNKANEAIRAEFATRISDLGAQVTTLTARAEAAEGKLNTQAAEFAQREAVNLVDQAIKDGKLLPKQKDLALAFMSGMKGTVNFGGAEKTPAQLFADFIGLAGKQVDTTERGSGKEGSRDVRQFATAGHEVDAKVNEAISASGGKLGYAEAMKKVLDGDADLASRYIKGE
jgi:hypothetical protein